MDERPFFACVAEAIHASVVARFSEQAPRLCGFYARTAEVVLQRLTPHTWPTHAGTATLSTGVENEAVGYSHMTELGKWLSRSRFGCLAYTEYRCSILHEGRPGERSQSFEFPESDRAPTYCSPIFSSALLVGFHPRFMARVLRNCIEEFHLEVRRANVDVVPHPYRT